MKTEREMLVEILEKYPGTYSRIGLINQLLLRGLYLRIAQQTVDALFNDRLMEQRNRDNGFRYVGR
jgi:hypothetical protein